jgi:beta-phosphoglucomutase-like phosphatase (HAD superfamily)
MTMVRLDPDRRLLSPACGGVPLRAVICDAAGTLVPDVAHPRPGHAVVTALERLRHHRLRLAVVHDGAADPDALRAALGPLDLVVAAHVGTRPGGDAGELGPLFVRRACARLGVEPAACVVVGVRRLLLAAAAWAGARTIMVYAEDTPAFQFRAMRHVVVDLPTAVDALLGWVS